MQPVPPPAAPTIRNTIHQTVVHLHPTTCQYIQNRLSVRTGGGVVLLVRQAAVQPPRDRLIDESRPALTARRLLRVLSAESARQTLRPFYQRLFQELLVRERETYRGRPARSLLLVQSVLGRRQTLTALERFSLRLTERRDASMLRRLLDRVYVRRIRWEEEAPSVRRYVKREAAVPEELYCLPTAGRATPPPPPPVEREAARGPATEPLEAPPPPALHLGDGDFRLLVRGVADALDRRNRLDALRRGGE